MDPVGGAASPISVPPAGPGAGRVGAGLGGLFCCEFTCLPRLLFIEDQID